MRLCPACRSRRLRPGRNATAQRVNSMYAHHANPQGNGDELSSARPPLPQPPRPRWPGWGGSGYPVSTHYALGMRLSLVAQRQAVAFLMRVLGFPWEIAVRIARLQAAPLIHCLHHIVICPSCGGLHGCCVRCVRPRTGTPSRVSVYCAAGAARFGSGRPCTTTVVPPILVIGVCQRFQRD
jgi:hypothetical protein